MNTAPAFLILTSDDCRAVLGRNTIGRLAFVHDSVVDIEPLGYTFDGDWLYFRSAYGAKLEALAHNPFVAFQVDEIDGPLDWRSVVAHGTVYLLDDEGGPVERRAYGRALKALREVFPAALTAADPTPQRDIVYGLHIDRVTGRMARSGSGRMPRRKPQPVRRPPKRRGTSDAS
jgi:nitroimidazol reductase NimA-like FMN-containing flavoprotein (pyridoxamine 5'-phosphate oxidase superfamily)